MFFIKLNFYSHKRIHMSKEQVEFENLVNQRGGISDLNSFPDGKRLSGLLKMLNAIVASYRNDNSKLPAPIIELIFSPAVNAFAMKDKDKYFVGIHLGAVYVLRDLINRMFANKSFLPQYGDSSNEDSPLIFNA